MTANLICLALIFFVSPSNKEQELENAEEIRQKDVAVYKQQIKFLMHEHQTSLAELQVSS